MQAWTKSNVPWWNRHLESPQKPNVGPVLSIRFPLGVKAIMKFCTARCRSPRFGKRPEIDALPLNNAVERST